MDKETKEVFRTLDDQAKLLSGEWTSDGRKLFSYIVTEIGVSNRCVCDDRDKKIVSGVHYFLAGKGNTPVSIWIYKGIENLDCRGEGEEAGVGTFSMIPKDEYDDEEVANIEIVLHPKAFEDFVHAVSALRFKGHMRFQVIVKKPPSAKTEFALRVLEYTFENHLQLPLEETT